MDIKLLYLVKKACVALAFIFFFFGYIRDVELLSSGDEKCIFLKLNAEAFRFPVLVTHCVNPHFV